VGEGRVRVGVNDYRTIKQNFVYITSYGGLKMGFKDLRQHLSYLEKNGMLKRVKKEIDRDWEIAALCREVFWRYDKESRPALLFENVKGFEVPVAAGVIGGSRHIYAIALGISAENMTETVGKKWADAIANRIPTKLVDSGPVKENILKGDQIDIFRFPHPIWTCGHDPGYFLTAPCVISRHPVTGQRNMGCYRCQLKEKNKTGIHMSGDYRHIGDYIKANNELNQPTPVAIVIGGDPTIPLTAVSGIPRGIDELEVAGALKGEPIEMVKCETINLEVPATAEIVIEGEIPPNYTEKEGPFGEYPGYMGPSGMAPIVNIKAITHRNNPIYHVYVSQMPPSESSLMRSFGRESGIYSHLKDRLSLPVKDVHITESGGAASYMIISVDSLYPGQFWQYIWGAWSIDPSLGKFTIIVDGDIDIRDPFQVEWAMSWRVRPNKDIYIVNNTIPVALDPALAPFEVPRGDPRREFSSKVVIDATRHQQFPPASLPPKEHIEKVRAMWNEYGID
jgi:UbiD family decarboxylase